ncbi:MAG: septation protein A, partial [Burkholderiaceae bacterium]
PSIVSGSRRMKFISDFFSLLLFFVVYLLGEQFPEVAKRYASLLLGGITRDGVIPDDQASILLAIAVAIIVFTIQIAWLLGTRRKVSVVQWMSFGVLVVFGGASIYFHSDTFIKWKVTVLYWAFAVALWAGIAFFRKNLIRALMEPGGVELPDNVWNRMNQSWIVFFVLLGGLNLLVAFNFSRTTWVTFKSFGLTVLTLLFALGQGYLISRTLDRIEAEDDEPKRDGVVPAVPAEERAR